MIYISVNVSGWKCGGNAKHGVLMLDRGEDSIFLHGTPDEIREFANLITQGANRTEEEDLPEPEAATSIEEEQQCSTSQSPIL